jgi:hypothetical protein
MRNEEFIQQRLLKESQQLLQAEFYFPVFFLVSQGLETLGSFLDKKPLGAKAQSKKRFHLAVNQLFPNTYADLIDGDWLYKQLRCTMSHMCSPGGFIVLERKTKSKHKHLQLVASKRVFIIEDLVSDFQQACLLVIEGLESGAIMQKAMAFSEIQNHKL